MRQLQRKIALRCISMRRPLQRAFSSPQPPLFPEELNILYDSKCGVCRLEMDWLASRDARLSFPTRKLKLTDIEGEDFDPSDPANGGVTYERGMAAIHAVTRDGRVIEGVPVFERAYGLVGLGWLVKFTEWGMMKPVVRWGYEVFARYRTIVTRGASLEDLAKAHRAKKEECSRCEKGDRLL
ncbi:hypothetical protein ACHAXT_001067 [Thalassiosira profunda]